MRRAGAAAGSFRIIEAGGTAIADVVKCGSNEYVNSVGVSISAFLVSGAILTIDDGGRASGGIIGASAIQPTIGFVQSGIVSGASIAGTENNYAVYIDDRVLAGGTASGAMISSGGVPVALGGTVT